TNTEADPLLSKDYTLVYDSPISSRISGVTVKGTTYPVSEDGKSIDMRAIGLMPAAADIQPVYILPDGNQTAKVTLNTETGAGTITVTNSEGKDYDGNSSHTYNLIFDSVDLSRPKTITIMNAAINKALTLTPAFDSKKYAYTVNGYRHDENIDDRVRFEWFDGKELTVEITSDGDEYDSPAPKLLVKVSNPNGGTDYDGEHSHTYSFTFNQRTHDNRSVSLGSLSVGGTAVPDFDSDLFDYYLDRPVIASESEIAYSILEYDGHTTDGTRVEVSIDTNAATATITVSNEISNSDGEDERIYTLHFLPYYSRLSAIMTAEGKVDLLEETGEVIRATLPGQMPKTVEDIEATLEFPEKTAGAIQHEMSLNLETATATIKVSNSKADTDGISSRTYTLKYDAPFFSRLESLVIGGVAVPGFNRNTFNYTIDSQMPANPTVTPTVIKGSNAEGKAEIKEKSANAEKALVTVVVTNTQPDIDGESSHTYTVQYNLPYFSRLESITIGGQELTGLPQDGKTPIAFAGQLPPTDEEAVALFSYMFKQCSGNPVATVVFDHINATARITVTNGGQKDIDGKTSHIYIVQFNLPYYSTASSITLDGEEIPDFNPSQLDYTLPGQLPEKDRIDIQLYNGNGSSDYTIDTDVESATVTITVTNTGDADGKYASTTVYTLHFDLPYFSRLASLKVRGEEVEGFDRDKFEYTIGGALPAQSEIVGTAMKASGKVSVSVSRNVAEGIATVTVTNSGGADLDGKKTHTYTLRFDKPVNSRLSEISINGTPLADFDTDVFTYRLTTVEMPAEGAVTAVSSNPEAKITIGYDSSKYAVTITVTADGADEDGKNIHTYTLNFKKPDAPAPSTGKTVEYTGTLNIYMMGDDITGGGQEAKVHIKENSDGPCTFSLPSFSLALG
ncbi:MAG: calycin-like domain-containing protein, partial [Paramuribaculum sp.]|nr:calycin-like domain-containing protein [Paramuribaculum sp.]